MRAKLPDNEIRNIRLIIRVSREEKILIQGHAKNGRYPFISDYIRVRIFNSNRKVITFDEEATIQILWLDYDLNKIGVNLNQIAKKINTHDVYHFTSEDRAVFKQVLQEHEHEIQNSMVKDGDEEILPNVHRIASILKRWLLGTQQSYLNKNKLEYYLDEFVFRYNRRTSSSRGLLFMRLIEQAVITAPVSYKEIIYQNHG